MLNNNFIATAASAIFITLCLNSFISASLPIRRQRYTTSREPGRFPRVLATIIFLFISSDLTVYNGYTPVQLLRGTLGDLSITKLILLIYWLWSYIHGEKPKKIPLQFALTVTLLGTVLYLSVFGFIAYDIYGNGYFPAWIFMLGFVVIEIYLWRNARIYAFVWLIALICFYFKFQSSHNLWDYLFYTLK